MVEALIAAGVGLLYGARHAFEPDHLAAVSTLATTTPKSPWRLGALWGLGHSLSLFALAGALALAEVTMPPRIGAWLELGVAAMLLVLGGRALWQAFARGSQGQSTAHVHHGVLHTHPAPREHVHVASWTLSARPLWIGLVHGLAGSGALTALVMAELHTAPARLLYIVLFGLGSTAGMAAMTGIFGASISRLRAPGAMRWLQGGAGAASVALGLFWAVHPGG